MTGIYYQDETVTLHHGKALDVARGMASGSVDCIVTSPPYYGLRDYKVRGQYGQEKTPSGFVRNMRILFSELRRVLADDGTLWLNLGDSYSGGNRKSYDTDGGKTRARGHSAARPDSGLPGKNLLGIPWRVAFALQKDGWILRNAIIWNKPNAMPESVTDRLSNRYEPIFLFSKSQRYWFDLDPIREKELTAHSPTSPRHQNGGGSKESLRAVRASSYLGAVQTNPAGKNPGDVWNINTQPFPGAHFAVFPQELARRAIAAGCRPGGTVLDPFSGSGTTGLVAQNNGRKYVGIDLNAGYLKLSLETRLQNAVLNLEEPA